MGRGISKEFSTALLFGDLFSAFLIFDNTKSREHSRIDAAGNPLLSTA
jgi:hypothetical protein